MKRISLVVLLLAHTTYTNVPQIVLQMLKAHPRTALAVSTVGSLLGAAPFRPSGNSAQDEIAIIPNPMTYVGGSSEKFSRELGGIEIKPQDPLIHVAFTGKHFPESWVMFYPEKGEAILFPSYIPLSLVDGKKEGDVITLKVGGKTINVICRQWCKKYCADRECSFESEVEMLKKAFLQHPNYSPLDTDKLLAVGILQKNPAKNAKPYEYVHGPNGFKG